MTEHTHVDYSAAPMGDQVGCTMACYPTQSHYPDKAAAPFMRLRYHRVTLAMHLQCKRNHIKGAT